MLKTSQDIIIKKKESLSKTQLFKKSSTCFIIWERNIGWTMANSDTSKLQKIA